jgi:hypothetical protein
MCGRNRYPTPKQKLKSNAIAKSNPPLLQSSGKFKTATPTQREKTKNHFGGGDAAMQQTLPFQCRIVTWENQLPYGSNFNYPTAAIQTLSTPTVLSKKA